VQAGQRKGCQGAPVWAGWGMDLSVSASLLPTIQLSITPVILITGLGSLLLTMTNRMGRIVDRTRILAGQARAASDGERAHLEDQLRIMYRRAQIVRSAVTLGVASMICSGLLVVAIFGDALLQANFAAVILGLFITSIGLLLGALGAFLRDIFLSLNALGLEVDRALDHPPLAS
jgi:hypothetical protein